MKKKDIKMIGLVILSKPGKKLPAKEIKEKYIKPGDLGAPL